MQDLVEELGIWYVFAVAASAVLLVAALWKQWSIYGLPAWILFAAVLVLGLLGAVVNVVRG